MHSAIPQPKQLGQYQVVETLAASRTWQMYRCFDPVVRRKLVLKAIPKAVLESSGAAVRARTEAEAAACLKHPGIVEVYGYGEDAGLAFVAMEYVEGWYLKERFRVPLSDAVNLIVQLLEALEYAHNQGVVHRAIKPSNLMLTTNGHLRITNFGVPRLSTDANHYAAPETLNNRVIDGRCDVFSAGAVFYELLTGIVPFPKQSGAPMEPRRVTPRPVSQINSSVPKVFDSVCAKALAQTVEERYASARNFADGVRGALAASNGAAPSSTLPRDSMILFSSPPREAKSGPAPIPVEGSQPKAVDTKGRQPASEGGSSRSGGSQLPASRPLTPGPNPAKATDRTKREPDIASVLGLGSRVEQLLGKQPTTLAGYLKEGSSQPEGVIGAFVSSTKALLDLYAATSRNEALLPQNICFDQLGKASIRVSPANVAHGTAVLSNPRYAAPEMFAEKGGGESSPAAANIYALGFMFYEILVGETLFEETFAAQRNDLDWLRWHADLQSQAPPLKSLLPECPLALSQVVESMLEKQVEKRNTDLNDILSRLRRVQQQSNNTLVLGSSASPRKPIAKVTRQPSSSPPRKTHRPSLWLIGIIVLLLGLSTFLVWRNPELFQEVITYIQHILGELSHAVR